MLARGETIRSVRCLWALAAALAVAGLAPGSARSAEERIWLDVARPYDGWVEVGKTSLVEVRGAAGTIGRGKLDVAVILDVSRSTRDGSGVDVNGDGHVGGIGWRYRRDWGSYLRHPQTSSDPGDSIVHAEIEAVRRLLERLNAMRSRIGILTFANEAIVRSSLGNPRKDHESALAALAREVPDGRTDMAEAITTAVATLRDAGATAGPYRQTAIILLSDGKPTVPSPDDAAEEAAVAAAQAAGQRGIRVHTVSLGASDTRALREIARVSRGTYTALPEPGAIIEALPRLDLQGVAEVSILNTTTGRRARAVRVWADGTFDGFVDLVKGKNQLRITALGPDGSRYTETRYVYYRQREPRDERERRLETQKLEHLRDFLRDRSVQVTIARERDAAERGGRHRDLTIETQPDAP